MKANLPSVERLLRLVAALLLVIAGFVMFTTGWARSMAWIGAAVLLTTAFVGWCPACAMLGRRNLQKPK